MKFIPKVLIVEDSALVRHNIKSAFNNTEIEFIEASDGYSAMEILEQTEEQLETVDLIICDINLPGINGLELITEKNNIKNYLPYIPVLMITSTSSGEVISETCKLNVTDILFKPFTNKDLQLKVSSIIDTLVNTDLTIKHNTMIIGASNFQSVFFKKTLEQIGAKKVEIVNNFHDAWTFIVSSSRTPYDLIITDWQIGAEECIPFIEKFRKKNDYQNTPVCITMSTLDPSKLQQIINIPLSTIIYKNINKEDLTFKIRYLFNLKNKSIGD
ncbi:MAG: response regulator [Oligoflexia bacterium]|nr:response regulator [Oligoflexia bacterium]